MAVHAQLSSLAKVASAALRLPKMFGGQPQDSLSTLLFHRFFLPGESLESGRERLRRRLDWLRQHYAPLTPAQAMAGLAKGSLPRFPALVTIDDVHVDFLKVEDIFRSFGVPVVLFACVGWADTAGPPEPQSLLARIVALLEWGEPVDQDLPFRRGSATIKLGEQHRADRAAAIDQLIAAREDLEPELPDLAAHLEQGVKARTCCNWNELKNLANAGVTIGCHSVSHVQLAKVSPIRMAFEIDEARKIILTKFGGCDYFAYPFGNRDSCSETTTAKIAQTGFQCAFLTHADFATGRTDRYRLPRLVVPDDEVSFAGFQAIVRGGAIPLDKAKRLLARN